LLGNIKRARKLTRPKAKAGFIEKIWQLNHANQCTPEARFRQRKQANTELFTIVLYGVDRRLLTPINVMVCGEVDAHLQANQYKRYQCVHERACLRRHCVSLSICPPMISD
jgi:hypothetical protein